MVKITLTILLRFSALGLLFLLGSSSAHAQGSSEYRQLVKQGVEEYDRGNWGEAYAMFEKAYRAQPGPRPLRGMAYALFELKRYVEAAAVIKAGAFL